MAVLDLYVSALGTEKTAWTRVGTTPYLNVQDEPTNYVYNTTKKAEIGDFDFADSGMTSEVINSVYLYVYSKNAAGRELSFYIWDGTDWTEHAIILGTTYGWQNIVVTVLDTWTKIDGAKLYIAQPNQGDRTDVDCVYLKIDYTTGVTQKNVTDVGSGADAVSLLGEIPVADSGGGADVIGLLGKIPVADAGSGADLASILATLSVLDAGAGVDSVSVQVKVPKLVTDVGAGADIVANVKAMLSVLDTGSGADQVAIKALVSITDTGSGVETLAINVTFSVLDTGAGVDAVSTLAKILVADNGTGVDVASILAKILVSDNGTGLDAIQLLIRLIISDTGSGLDVIAKILNSFTINDVGLGVDFVDVDKGAVPILVTDVGLGVDAVSATEIILKILRLLTKMDSQFNITSHYSRGLNLSTKERSDLDITSIIKGGGE